ncbi:MAG: hypothetical protein APF76_17240 [Desulfitibacter sp. BRH_c19]|nr:MAG: hypothetical protein APF76_17240 [Desulfitibacter sp. BRH_c19]
MSQSTQKRPIFEGVFSKEDWFTVWLGAIVIVLGAAGAWPKVVMPAKWGVDGLGFFASIPGSSLTGIIVTGILCLILFAFSMFFTNKPLVGKFAVAFPMIFIIAILAEILGKFAPLSHYGLNSVVWALVLGLLISNTIKTPDLLKPGVKTELYIKTGLVLLGASILFDRMLTLGVLGIGVAWLVTPVVIIFMYWYSQSYLKMQENRGLAITIAAATSVCGVSAAIAAGTAAKAKKEEISLAIGISLIFTVIMMVAMPALVVAIGMDPYIGAAWMGGTIDATGAVVAAGTMLGDEAMEIASVIKMIQNILIGLSAFVIAVFWVVRYEGKSVSDANVGASEIWFRMPKFILGFIGASIIFSFFLPDALVSDTLGVVNGYRKFFFTLAFVSIGLESNFGDMAKLVKGGKPLNLYIVGQTFNLVLTLIAAYVFFSGNFFALPF